MFFFFFFLVCDRARWGTKLCVAAVLVAVPAHMKSFDAPAPATRALVGLYDPGERGVKRDALAPLLAILEDPGIGARVADQYSRGHSAEVGLIVPVRCRPPPFEDRPVNDDGDGVWVTGSLSRRVGVVYHAYPTPPPLSSLPNPSARFRFGSHGPRSKRRS